MRNFITPLKSNETALQSGNSKDQKSKISPEMFEDELGDDFLTSWKPTKMAIDVDLDLYKVQGPKSAAKTKFASSKMDMDFDFDGGFSKLSSFDIDLSFNSPASPAKKPKKPDLPKQPKPVDLGNELEFDLKGFNTEDLEEMKVAEKEKLSESEPHRVRATTAIDHEQSETLGKGQTEDMRDDTTYVTEDPISAQPDARRKSASSLLESDPNIGHHSSRDTAGVVHHEQKVYSNSELTLTAVGSNVQPVSPAAIENEEAKTEIFRSRIGLESDAPTRLNPVLQSGTIPAGSLEEQSPRSEGSETTYNESRTKFSDQDPLVQDLEREHVKQQTPNPEKTPTRPKSSTVLNDQNEVCASLDPQRCSTLQFDPLSKSSQTTVAAVRQSETFGQAESRYESRSPELADETRANTVKDHHREIAILESGEHTLPASGPPKPVATRPAIAALSLSDSKAMQEEGEEEACASAFNKSSPAVPCVFLGGKGRDSVSTHAPAVSIQTTQTLRGDHVEGKHSLAREDPNLGQLKSKTAPTLGYSSKMTLKDKNTIPNQKTHKFGASKRPSAELSGSTNKLQSGLQRTSPLYSEEDQGDSCRRTHVRAKKERRQTVRYNVAGFPTALTPVDGIRQGLEFQSSIITSTVRAQNQLSSRTLTTSRFFATDVPTSTEREVGHQIHTPRPDLRKSSRLISSTTCQLRAQTQPNMLVGDKKAVRKITGISEVSKSKCLQTNSSSQDSLEIRTGGTNAKTLARPQPHSSGRNPLQSSPAWKPQVEGRNAQPGRRTSQERPSLERVEAPVPSCDQAQNQNLPMSTEIQVEHVPAHGSADLLISENTNIVELSIQHTDKLDAMLKVLRKLNDDAKDILVRALVINNKLMMLDSPLTEYQIQKIKNSVMEALGTDGSDKQL